MISRCHIVSMTKKLCRWKCSEYTKYFWESDENYCDLKYTAPEDLFWREGLATNLGRLTIKLSQFLAKHGWALMLCNGGSVTPQPKDHPNRTAEG